MTKYSHLPSALYPFALTAVVLKLLLQMYCAAPAEVHV